MIVDSIQTVFTQDLEGAPGNVGQVRECAARLMRFAKETGTATFVVGHVTKGGGIAGPKTLEHIVDTVLYFEGESTLDHRILRATKNRFGSVDEIGVFRMTQGGLLAVENPSELFMGDRHDVAIEVEDDRARASAGGAEHAVAHVDGPYFQAMRIPLRRVRTFGPQDAGRPSEEAIVSRAFAERYWPGASPIGRLSRRAWTWACSSSPTRSPGWSSSIRKKHGESCASPAWIWMIRSGRPALPSAVRWKLPDSDAAR
jgi:hypothetical protein